MKKRMYELANGIEMKVETATICESQKLHDRGIGMRNEEAEKYKRVVLKKIRSIQAVKGISEFEKEEIAEKRSMQKQNVQKRNRRVIAAACVAAFLVSMTIFSEEVHAAIAQIGYSISSALGLSEDVAKYCDVVDSSATDAGYVITLQEAIAVEDKLIVTYTLQKEDGEPMDEIRIPQALLFINGTQVQKGFVGNGNFIDEEHTVVGIAATYDVVGIDMAQENSYQLLFKKIDSDTKGEWDFRFTADGTDLAIDSLRIPLQKEFTIDEKADIILEELVLNALEQKITFHINGPAGSTISKYYLQAAVEDGNGHIVQFTVQHLDGVRGDGYMLNNTYLEDAWISEEADTLTLTLSVMKITSDKEQADPESVQLGESFTVELNSEK